jgi:intraflagellar transport protein 56
VRPLATSECKLHTFHTQHRYWEGKRGAAIGVFQQVIAGKENREMLNEVIAMLRNTQSPQVEYFVKIIGKWIKENPSH